MPGKTSSAHSRRLGLDETLKFAQDNREDALVDALDEIEGIVINAHRKELA
jgi:hypothetical protein